MKTSRIGGALRRLLALSILTALAVPLAGGAVVPAMAQDFVPFVAVDAAPDGAKITLGEHFAGTEFSNTRPLSDGAVGPVPVFYADDGWGCQWTTAAASGVAAWIGLAQRDATPPAAGDACPAFQQKLATAQAAGAKALIVINNVAGTAGGTGAASIPGVIIDQTEGGRLRDSLKAGDPSAVKVTLGLFDSETFVPYGTLLPTSVGSLEASAASGTVSVTGSAVFEGDAPLTVGTDAPGDGPIRPDLADKAGVDLLSADVSQPDPSAPQLLFQWHVTNLPPTGAMPEFTLYRWGIRINNKTNYVLQAKFTNLISTAYLDDPQGPPTHVGAAFQLRGTCGTIQGTVGNCNSLAFLNGHFNTATGTVQIYLPLGQSYAPDIVPGAVITPFKYDFTSIVAGFTAGTANQNTLDGLDWDTDTVPSYTIPSSSVLLGIAPAGTAVSQVNFDTPATLDSEGSFSGTLGTGGLAAGSYDVYAKACFGSNCGVGTTTITL